MPSQRCRCGQGCESNQISSTPRNWRTKGKVAASKTPKSAPDRKPALDSKKLIDLCQKHTSVLAALLSDSWFKPTGVFIAVELLFKRPIQTVKKASQNAGSSCQRRNQPRGSDCCKAQIMISRLSSITCPSGCTKTGTVAFGDAETNSFGLSRSQISRK